MRDHVKGGALTEVTFFILLSVYQSKHGYAIMQFIEDRTAGRLVLGAGTLYGALAALQQKGWIALCDNNGSPKKKYHITSLGHEIALQELKRLKELTAVAEIILGG